MKILLSSFLSLLVQHASAISLNGRTNDDLVCDLSPYTTSRLSQLTPVDGNSSNLSEIYERLALRWITISCRDRQQLILHSDLGLRMEDVYFRNVATKLCGSGQVVREVQSTADSPHAFQVKCTINRLQQAKSWLERAESERSSDSLISASSAASDDNEKQLEEIQSKESTDRQARCKRGLTYGALIGVSGGCRN